MKGSKSTGFRWLVALGVLVVVAGAYVVTSQYTSRPAFCNTCHEMTPYYAAWQGGAHAEVSCISCHVDPGFVADLAHKPAALYEVWVHFTGDPTFPTTEVPLPDSRCLGCHPGTVDPGLSNFDHEQHRQGLSCKTCHDTTGHAVTAAALSAAGILNAEVQAQRDARTVAMGAGSALGGHVAVSCSNCHDMATSACSACHEPPADHPAGVCTDCHSPGDSWAFEHPDIRGEHSSRSFACILCHPTGPPEVNCTCHGGRPPTDD